MFKSLKSLWGAAPQEQEDNTHLARELAGQIAQLEAQLDNEPGNSDIQKKLMLTYNRALNVYASSKEYRQCVDNLFERIDALRNLIRRNI